MSADAPQPVTRRRLPRAQREQLILDEADRTFAERGYHASSMEDIAAGAGVTKPVVYAYFGSKDGLYLAALERAGERLAGLLAGAGEGLAPAVRVDAATRAFVAFVREQGPAWVLALGSAEGPVAAAVAEHRGRITRLVAQALVVVGEDRGAAVSPALADAGARAVVGAAEALAAWAVEGPETRDEPAARRLSAVVLAMATA